MTKTLRASDSAAEVEIGKFLDKHFYPKHSQKFLRYSDYSNQMSGLDVTFDYGELQQIKVDEKAAVHYVNKNLPTFAFEIDFLLRTGEVVEGWLFNKNKVTEYYLLVWLWAKKDRGFHVDDITKVHLVLVSRKKIIHMLQAQGFDEIKVKQTSRSIRSSGRGGVINRQTHIPFYFFYSPQLAERPVNIIIKRAKLEELAEAVHTISV